MGYVLGIECSLSVLKLLQNWGGGGRFNRDPFIIIVLGLGVISLAVHIAAELYQAQQQIMHHIKDNIFPDRLT